MSILRTQPYNVGGRSCPLCGGELDHEVKDWWSCIACTATFEYEDHDLDGIYATFEGFDDQDAAAQRLHELRGGS